MWDWRDIHAVSAGYLHTIGLTANGRVIGAGHRPSWAGSEDWREVVDVDAGSHHSLALTKRGRVLATGSDEGGQCQVQDWREVVAIAAGAEHSLGLRADAHTGADSGRSPHERRLHCPLARESRTTEGQSPHRTGPDQTETVVQT